MAAAIPPTINEVRDATTRIRDVVLSTPLVPLHGESFSNPNVLLKLETLQSVNSFKIRGVFNAVASMSDADRKLGISTVSAGNTAQALAWVGRYFGVPARSVMPESAPTTKIEAVKAYGGTPVLVPMDEVFRYMKEHLWEEEPFSFVHPWTNRDVMIGHASLGLEIVQDCPDVDTVFVPVGGGGLLGGVGSAIKALRPEAKIVAVEPEECASFHASLAAGRAVSAPCKTICDGVAVPYMTDEMFPLLSDLVDRCELVSEDAVKVVLRQLALGNKLVVEPSAALATAAALAIPESERGRSVCLVTGGSIDTAKFISILNA